MGHFWGEEENRQEVDLSLGYTKGHGLLSTL